MVVFLFGRIILGSFYLFNACSHFTKLKMLADYAARKGVPASPLTVLASSVLLLVGGLSILLGAFPKVGVAALTVFFIPTTFWMHNFWEVQDPILKRIEMVNFTKNMALLGAMLMLLAIPEPWPLSLVR